MSQRSQLLIVAAVAIILPSLWFVTRVFYDWPGMAWAIGLTFTALAVISRVGGDEKES